MGYLFVFPSLIGIKYLDNFLQLEIDLAEHQPSGMVSFLFDNFPEFGS